MEYPIENREYIIKTFDKETIPATHKEVQDLIGKTGIVRFPENRGLEREEQFLNISSIERIIPARTYEIDQLENRKSQKEGFLHDGTKVIKHFGTWYLDGEFDERGRPSKVIDMEYYPEVARDCVPTIQEYERKLRQLPRKARLKAILGGREVELDGQVNGSALTELGPDEGRARREQLHVGVEELLGGFEEAVSLLRVGGGELVGGERCDDCDLLLPG